MLAACWLLAGCSHLPCRKAKALGAGILVAFPRLMNETTAISWPVRCSSRCCSLMTSPGAPEPTISLIKAQLAAPLGLAKAPFPQFDTFILKPAQSLSHHSNEEAVASYSAYSPPLAAVTRGRPPLEREHNVLRLQARQNTNRSSRSASNMAEENHASSDRQRGHAHQHQCPSRAAHVSEAPSGRWRPGIKSSSPFRRSAVTVRPIDVARTVQMCGRMRRPNIIG